jgi:hypothetical protein
MIGFLRYKADLGARIKNENPKLEIDHCRCRISELFRMSIFKFRAFAIRDGVVSIKEGRGAMDATALR